MIIKIIEKTSKNRPLKGGKIDWKLSKKNIKKQDAGGFMSFSEELKKQSLDETNQTLLFINDK